MDFESAQRYLARVAPFDGVNYINIHRKTFTKSGGTVFWGTPCLTLEEALEHLKYLKRKRWDADVFLAMGSHKEAGTKPNFAGGTFKTAIRYRDKAFGCKALYADLDVKPDQLDKAYGSTREAVAALNGFCEALPMPSPNVVVKSGTGGVHAYWTFDKTISAADWQERADALAAALTSQGVKFDSQCTVDAVRLLRIPETWNAKQTPHLPVELLKCEEDFTLEVLDAALAAYFGKVTINPTPPQAPPM